MLTAIVLICSLAASPDLSDFSTCTRENAIDVIVVPGEWRNPIACMRDSLAYVAETEIGQSLTANEIVHAICERREPR